MDIAGIADSFAVSNINIKYSSEEVKKCNSRWCSWELGEFVNANDLDKLKLEIMWS